MDCVSPILDVVTRVWDCTSKQAVYIKDLQENLESLRNAKLELKDVYQDVKGRVEREEQRQMMKRTNEVRGWLLRVQLLETQVDEILQKGDQEIQKKCFFGTTSCCPRNCVSSYKLGKKASEKIAAVTELRNRGRFDHVVAGEILPQVSPADERPMQKTVGLNLMYEEVCRSIQDEQLGIIGLYGMGGAGKTTLMTKVNNDYLIRTSNDFDIAIWIVVSRPARVEKVQEVIRNKLKIPDDTWRNRSQEEKAVEIFNVLKVKRFVMLLDDVWERLDLEKVGVPSPSYSQNKSKVVLTTRSLDVCRLMEAQKSIKVECLTKDEAINLFKERVGETTLNSHPEIPHLAEIAAKECKGLPLALITIGRALAGKNTPQEWERAIQILKTYPSKLSGMGDHVFPILKFSYDNLPNDTIKACFLYLAIFPEDHSIYFSDLILLWIGEGFLDECINIDDAFSQGRDIIDHLKTACLFEGDENNWIKMHDVIRDMALWLATTYSDNQNKILAVENDIVEVHQVSKWKEVQRMHLSFSSMAESSIPPSFPNLLTLIVKGEGLKAFPSGFFHFMPIIKVLDLSNNAITKLPIGIGKLVTLEYLDLSHTRLTEFSTELKALKKMRCLLLHNVPHLKMIPKEAISNLPMMRIFVLSFYALLENENGRVREEAKHSRQDNQALDLRKDNKALLEELEGLEHVNFISFQIEYASSFQKLLSSQKLKNAMRSLTIGNLEGMNLLQLPRMKHLQGLRIYCCLELEHIRVDIDHQEKVKGGRRFVEDYYNYNNNIPADSNFCWLRRVHIDYLPKLLELTWVIYIPSLETLSISSCESMEDVIGDGVSGNLGIFSRLADLKLSGLPNLRSINRRALPFPCLTTLIVYNCPNLRKLPFDSNSTTTTRNSLKNITGQSKWWEGLEWEDETIRLTFTPYFRAIRDG